MEEKNQSDQLIDLQAAAARLLVSPSWLYGRIHQRNLPFPYLKIGTDGMFIS